MNLKELFHIQKELDQKINANHQLGTRSLLREKCMALTVETAELANETRVFKYWSLKGPSAKDIILEEYVDCLHFMLSIGLEQDNHQAELRHQLQIDLTSGTGEDVFELFEQVFDYIQRFAQSGHINDYQQLFHYFIALGKSLSFKWEEIEQAYFEKNRVNHERQEQGY